MPKIMERANVPVDAGQRRRQEMIADRLSRCAKRLDELVTALEAKRNGRGPGRRSRLLELLERADVDL